MELFLLCRPLSEDSATKLKRGQLNVCTVYVYCVWCTVLFSPLRLKFVPDWPAISVSLEHMIPYGLAECLMFML